MKYKNIKRSLQYIPRCIWHPVMRLMHAWGYDEPVMIPVPLHKKRQKERGFNQSSLIASHIACITGFSHDEHLLMRTRYTIPQATLVRQERLTNVKDAFAVCRAPETDKNYVLIDDVATTLSTLEACAKTLKEAGCKRVGAFVLARK